MEDFFEKEDYSEIDINQLIEGDIEESLNLEFKASGALGKQAGKKKDIAKEVSAFANSDGGIVIYGVEEEEHVASGLSFINGDDFTKEWIEQIINTNIQRRIKGVKIFPIRFDDKIDQTIYIVKIPASSWTPHMCKNNRYYRRFNFESVPMEEYEVRNLFNRREKSEIQIENIQIQRDGFSSRGGTIMSRNYEITCNIRNYSNSVEKNYKILLGIPSEIKRRNRHLNQFYDHSEDDMGFYSIPGNAPIFQNETITMFTVSIKIERDEIIQVEDEFYVKLFYSNGSEEVTKSFLNVMQGNGIDPVEDFGM